MFSLETYLKERKTVIDQILDKRMPAATVRPAVLHEAMRYSVFSGGKRLRPILCLAACEVVGGAVNDAIVPACAIELLHTYTLIHDDLPAMDDDEERRGKPTCHVKFGEANAILTGDALLTMTFEWLADYPRLAKELAQAAGSQGTVAGQVEDMVAALRPRKASPRGRQAQGEKDLATLLEYIHLNKTAKLIQASVRIGALAGKAEARELAVLSTYGEKIGLAFQLTDDVLDEKDAEPMTAIKVYGREGAMQRARKLVTEAKKGLRKNVGDVTVLSAIADFIVERTT